MRRISVSVALGFAAAVAIPRLATAQGYGVYEQGTCAMGRAGTGVAAPCADGSSLFFNPAGMVAAEGRQIAIGGTGIAVSGSFTNDVTGLSTDLNSAVYPVPHVYLVQPVRGGRAAVGIGAFAPYGLTTEWPETFEGRFLGYRSKIQAVYIQPTIAIRLTDQVSFGAGLDVSLVSVQLRQRLELSSQIASPPFVTFGNLGIPYGTEFGDVNLTGSGHGIGYHLGLMLTPVDKISIGARYLSRQLVTVDGATAEISQIQTGIILPPNNPVGLAQGNTGPIPLDVLLAPQFGAGGPLTNQEGSTYLRLPEQLVVGAAWQATPKARLLFDVQYTNWTVFEKLDLQFEKLGQRVIEENYRKAYGYRMGGEYAFSPTTTARLGYYTHSAAAPPETVTPNLPEGGRNSFTVGLGTRLGRSLSVDLAYQYIDQADRRGRTVEPNPALPGASNNNGLYKFKAHLFGATFAYAF